MKKLFSECEKMPLKIGISLNLRVKICNLIAKGFSYSEIAKKVGVSKSNVSDVINRFRKTGSHANETGRKMERKQKKKSVMI